MLRLAIPGHRQWCDTRRRFSAAVKRAAFKRCEGHCRRCTAPVTGAGDIIFDHVVPWAMSRDSSERNCQVLCLSCDAVKTPADNAAMAKADRQADFHVGIKGPGRGRNPMPCGRASDRSKTMGGQVVVRRSPLEKHRAAIAARYPEIIQ